MKLSDLDCKDLVQKIESLKGVEECYAVKHLSQFLNGTMSVSSKKGKRLKMQVAFPAEIVLNSPDSVPMNESDWKLQPLLVFVKLKKD